MSAHLAVFGRLVLEVVISIQAHSVTAGRAPMILASFGGREQRIAAMLTSICCFSVMPSGRRWSRVPLDRATPS